MPADVVIEVDGIWKVFGRDAKAALAAITKDGLTKPEVLKQFGCVVGVQDASFSVRQGEIFCIMGLSGSGKSTLVRHVNRLIEPTAGRIRINGEDVGSLNPEALRAMRAEKIGMVFQNMALLPHRTVRDNVAFALELRGIDPYKRQSLADETIARVNLQGYGDRYPVELSGGMQQRVGLARALAADPDILIMDEPFSALDPLIRRQLQDQFLSLSKDMGKTTLFITHDLDEAIRMGSRIAIMKDGVIVQIGVPEEIVTKPADDYVADFVAGISRLKLVYAHTVMEPYEAWKANGGARVDDGACLQATTDTDLNGLINLAVESDNPILIRDDGRVVGVVTKTALLRGIQGEP
jgi:glycine betaine/proline transport system ATP-binding protein